MRLGGDVASEPDERGRVRYLFPRIEREMAALERVRAAAARDEASRVRKGYLLLGRLIDGLGPRASGLRDDPDAGPSEAPRLKPEVFFSLRLRDAQRLAVIALPWST